MKTKIFKYFWIVAIALGLFHCTKTTLATEVTCKEVKNYTHAWGGGQGQVSETPSGSDQVQLKGIGSKNTVLILNNAVAKLLSIKADDVEGSYQYFEKSPLGTPNVWAFYPKNVAYKTKMARHVLVRMRTFREDMPVSVTTIFECD